MTSLTRSSITGLYHPKRSLDSIGSSSITDTQKSLSRKSSAVDRLLNADKSGFLPTDSLTNSSRSSSNLDLSNTSSSSSLEKSLLETQLKRAISSNEVMEASIKRLRTESQYSIKDLIDKNETLEHSLHESKIKISELEHLLDKAKQQTITAEDTVTPISIYEERIKTLENDKLELKLQLQQHEHLHTKEVAQLEKMTNDLKHQLADTKHKLNLSQIDQDKLKSISKNTTDQLNEKIQQVEQLQKRVIELELIISTLNPTNAVNRSLVEDLKQITNIRYQKEELKKELELFKLKYNERLSHDEELRTLRQQTKVIDDYRTVIAKQEAEILKLREQSANENKTDGI